MTISLFIKTLQPDRGKILNSVQEGDGFSAKAQKKADFIVKMTGPAMVLPTSSSPVH